MSSTMCPSSRGLMTRRGNNKGMRKTSVIAKFLLRGLLNYGFCLCLRCCIHESQRQPGVRSHAKIKVVPTWCKGGQCRTPPYDPWGWKKNARSLVDGTDKLYNTKSHELFFMILSANAPASRAAIFDVAAPDDATFMYFTLPLRKRNNFKTSAPMGNFWL